MFNTCILHTRFPIHFFPGKIFRKRVSVYFPALMRDGGIPAGMQEWRSGESNRLPTLWPGFEGDLASHVSWVWCWFSSLLRGFFSGFSAGCTIFRFLAIIVLLLYFCLQTTSLVSQCIYLGGYFRFGNIDKNLKPWTNGPASGCK